jgi:hypothetical protein
MDNFAKYGPVSIGSGSVTLMSLWPSSITERWTPKRPGRLTEAEAATYWQACEQARQAQQRQVAANEAANDRPRNNDGTLTSAATTCGTTVKNEKQPDRTSTAKATASQTNHGAVDRTEIRI